MMPTSSACHASQPVLPGAVPSEYTVFNVFLYLLKVVIRIPSLNLRPIDVSGVCQRGVCLVPRWHPPFYVRTSIICYMFNEIKDYYACYVPQFIDKAIDTDRTSNAFFGPSNATNSKRR